MANSQKSVTFARKISCVSMRKRVCGKIALKMKRWQRHTNFIQCFENQQIITN